MSKSRALHAKFKEQVGHVFRLVAAADGLVDVKGLRAAFKALGTHLTAAEAQQLLEKVDWDCDGFVDLDEFTRAATGLVAIEGAESADDVASKGQSQSQIRTEPTSPSTPLALNARRQSDRPGGHMLTETAKRWEWWAGAGTTLRTNSHDSVHSATDSVGAGAVTAGVARACASPSRSARMDVPPSLPLWSSDRLRKQKLRQREAKRGSEEEVELEMEMERAAWDEAADGNAHAHARGGGRTRRERERERERRRRRRMSSRPCWRWRRGRSRARRRTAGWTRSVRKSGSGRRRGGESARRRRPRGRGWRKRTARGEGATARPTTTTTTSPGPTDVEEVLEAARGASLEATRARARTAADGGGGVACSASLGRAGRGRRSWAGSKDDERPPGGGSF